MHTVHFVDLFDFSPFHCINCNSSLCYVGHHSYQNVIALWVGHNVGGILHTAQVLPLTTIPTKMLSSRTCNFKLPSRVLSLLVYRNTTHRNAKCDNEMWIFGGNLVVH